MHDEDRAWVRQTLAAFLKALIEIREELIKLEEAIRDTAPRAQR